MTPLARILGLLSLAVFVAGLAVYVATFIPGSGVSFHRVLMLPIGMMAAAIAAAIHYSILRERSGVTKDEFENLTARLTPGWARRVGFLLFVFMLVNGIYFMAVVKGSPEVRDGRFVLVSHGKVVGDLATEEEYHAAERFEVRGMSGPWLLFSALAAFYCLYLYPRLRAAPAADAAEAGG